MRLIQKHFVGRPNLRGRPSEDDSSHRQNYDMAHYKVMGHFYIDAKRVGGSATRDDFVLFIEPI